MSTAQYVDFGNAEVSAGYSSVDDLFDPLENFEEEPEPEFIGHPLHMAIANKDINAVKNMCRAGMHLNERANDQFGTTPIFVALDAIRDGCGTEFLSALLVAGADPNMSMNLVLLPINYAICNELVDAIHLLYQYGVEKNALAVVEASRTLNADVIDAVCRFVPVSQFGYYAEESFWNTVGYSAATFKGGLHSNPSDLSLWNWDSVDDRERVLNVLNCLKTLFSNGVRPKPRSFYAFSRPPHPFVSHFVEQCCAGVPDTSLSSYRELWGVEKEEDY